MSVARRIAIAIGFSASISAFIPTVVFAQGASASAALPDKMTILVGVAPGGPNDSIARLVAERLRVKHGINAIVDNRVGANGLIAANNLLTLPPNGQNILIMSQGLATISPHLTPMPFDPLKDLTAIAGLATTDVGFCIGNHVPVDNLKDFVRYAQQSPTPLNFGAAGVGNTTHILLERLKDVAKVPFTLVVYKGILPSLQDLAGGHIDGSACALGTAGPLVKAGKIKLIAMYGDKRSRLFPDVPTMAEQGYPVNDPSWYGVFGPPKMPPAVVNALFSAIKEIGEDPEAIAAMQKTAFDPWIQDPAKLSAIMREESARYGKLIRDNNIKGE